MLNNFFKKKDAVSGINQAIEAAKMFGFDVYGWVEKNIPEWAAKARQMEDEVGSKLFVSLDLNSTRQYFILCVWKQSEAGNLEHYLSYPLHDIQGLLELIKNELNNKTNDTANPPLISQAGTGTNNEAGTAGEPGAGTGSATTGTEDNPDYTGFGSIAKQ